VAREGYVNLLLANKKRSQEPGDNKKMIQSRRQFLDKGFYEPLSNGVNEIVQTFCTSNSVDKPVNLLDCGCGEGYFLHQLNRTLRSIHGTCSLWGVDISKFAVKSAAKRDKSINWAIASAYDLPILSESLDFVQIIMAPYSHEEIVRALKPKGKILIVTPGPRHLFSLREQLYDSPQEHVRSCTSLPSLKLISTHVVKYYRQLRHEDIVELLLMTPYSWNASSETRVKIMQLQELEIEIEFVLTLLTKSLS
jgi:23S rRNA (guanine745-N1)-methyltransferase